jgi:Transposase DDE domain group 1
MTTQTSATGKAYKFVSKFTKGYRWEPKKIVYEATDEDLTAAGGIGNIVDLFCESPHFDSFRAALPVRQSNFSYDTSQFGLTVLSSFWFDHECVEDAGEFEFDPGVHTKLDGVPKPRAIGDWFRDFDETNISALNEFLIRQSLSFRKKLAPFSPIIIDIDSTSHVQSGTKMEGLAYNYKDEWCLDSLVAFDELGFGYNMDLRAGNTFSSTGAPEMIRRIFSVVRMTESSAGQERYVRGDSAFCNEECIQASLLSDVKFSFTAHGNTGWEKEARSIPDEQWSKWEYSKADIESSEKKKKPLLKAEVATFIYQPGWSENLRFTIVVKRTWREHEQTGLFSGQGYWDYYAVLTNISLYKFTSQSIMEHHAQRGNSENFIREAKYGYDLKHFPCKKMRANHAYGLLALVAHNFHRAMALVDNPDNPHFAKRLRRKLIFIPGKLIDHARTLTMRIPTRFMEEVKRFRQAWEAPPKIPPLIRLKAWSTIVFVP